MTKSSIICLFQRPASAALWLALCVVLSWPGARLASAQQPLGDALEEMHRSAIEQGEVRVIVGFGADRPGEARPFSGFTREERRERIHQIREQVLRALPSKGAILVREFRDIPFVAMRLDEGALEELVKNSLVSTLELDRLHRPEMASANAVIGSEAAWGAGLEGEGQVVAILDTGVDTLHPFFSAPGKIAAEACFSSSGSSPDSVSACPGFAQVSTEVGSAAPCATTGCGHGTQMAGVAVGRDPEGIDEGVAPEAGLIAIQVFSDFYEPSLCSPYASCALSYTSDQIAALEHVLELADSYNVVAANLSLGDGGNNPGICDSQSPAFKDVVDRLRDAGVATVVSSGNQGYRQGMSAPACISSVVSVGSTTDGDQVATFSNISGQTSLLAPGVSITSSNAGGGKITSQGTSFSAPIVAGALALAAESDPDATVEDLIAQLVNSDVSLDDQRSGGVVTSLPRLSIADSLGLDPPLSTRGMYMPMTPCRLVDARTSASGWAVGESYPLTLSPSGRSAPGLATPGRLADCQLPSGIGISAVHLNITMPAQVGGGYARAWKNGTSEPSATFFAWSPGQDTSNAVVLPLCSESQCSDDLIMKFYSTDSAPLTPVIELFGYFLAN